MTNLEFWIPFLTGLAALLALTATRLWISAALKSNKLEPMNTPPAPNLGLEPPSHPDSPHEALYRALAYRLAHDYSNPLQTMMFRLDQMGDKLPKENVSLRQDVDILIGQVSNMVRLTEEAKRQLRLEHPNRAVIRQPLDLPRLCEEVMAFTLPKASERGVALSYVGVPSHPIIFGDRAKLWQVLVNLVDNGIKYTRTEGGEVELSVMVDDDSKMIELSVSDNGRGIPTTTLNQLGDRPFPRHDTQEHRGSGTGLGLYNAKGIIKEHGGRFEARNRKEGGAMFIVALPLYWAAPAEEGNEPQPLK